MKNKLLKFMSGRYGIDQLYRFLLLNAVVCILISTLLSDHSSAGVLFNIAAFALLAWAVFRIFSRNIEKRYLENLHYMEQVSAMQRKIHMRKVMHHQRKNFKFFVCPTCKTNLRVPKGKGKVNITCCKCGNRFQGKT